MVGGGIGNCFAFVFLKVYQRKVSNFSASLNTLPREHQICLTAGKWGKKQVSKKLMLLLALVSIPVTAFYWLFDYQGTSICAL